MNRHDADIFKKVIMSLPEDDRAYVVMNRLEDMTYTEIAKMQTCLVQDLNDNHLCPRETTLA